MKEFKNGRDVIKIQGCNGNWNYDPYMHGLYNGMEMMLSQIEEREPNFKDAPKKWLREGRLEKFLRTLFMVPRYKEASGKDEQ